MSRPTVLSTALLIVVLAACNDDRMPTAPQTAAPAAISATAIDAPSTSGGISSICLVNQKALANLDGQLQDNPGNESLQAQFAVQSEITADVCS